ncbi:MAG: S41 family peptidase [Alistipes sp.]|nr:S41 family peptidase [Alistipes sp.]
MNGIRKTLKYAATAVAAVAAAGLLIFAGKDDFGLGRNMELLVNMMRELSRNYVDAVDADELMEGAAEGMVRRLDPYTTYLSEEETKKFELQTTGKYGGIGSLIRKRGDYVVIAEPYKGSPADRAGLRVGDKIVAIGREDAKGFSTEEVSSRLKGDPNTTVKITVERLADGSRETMNIRRERISIPAVTYAGWVADGIGYIQHADFSDGSYDELRAAIERLQGEGELKGLILDYRNNGGGVMQEAVKIVSLFVPKGTEVVTTKGRAVDAVRTYSTTHEPLLPSTPLAVLVNGNTASSSEIVAGALQDMDRAVLIGQKSFGKGLVQSTLPIGYDACLKITTAKYYIPSGRCIQNIDYSSHDDNVHAVPDSLVREFATRNGRKVYDGGGIMPDVKTETEYISRFALTLYAMGFIDDFCDDYVRRHPSAVADNRTFAVTDADYDDFKAFMKDKDVPYTSESRRALERLRAALESEKYADRFADRLAAMERELGDDTQSNLETYRKEITESIESALVMRYNYAEGAIEHSLVDDGDVARAVEILRDGDIYRSILTERDTVVK